MNKPILAAVAVSVSLVLWMVSGLAKDAEISGTTEQEPTKPAKLMQVEVTPSIAQVTSKLVTLQGQVEPFRVVNLRSEVDGRVEALPIEQGQRVKAGTVLLRQQMKFRQALKTQAEAQVAHRQSTLKANLKLHAKGLLADTRIAEEKAALAAAQAQLAQIQYEIDNVNLKAPFNGVLNERLVELGDLVDSGQQVATLVDDATLKITAMVPQHQVGSMAIGQEVVATMINGEVAKGKLTYISATADEATRSYRIEVLVDNAAGKQWVGMSSTLSVPVAELEGHRVSTSVVGLDTAGQLQVKVLEAGDIVKAYPVKIIRTESDSLWLGGLPHQVQLITLGQDFVIDGQQVVGRPSGDKKAAQG